MKAETSETSEATPSSVSTVVATPDNVSQTDTDGESISRTEEGVAHSAVASTSTAVAADSGSSTKGKGKSTSESAPSVKEEATPPKTDSAKAGSKHLVGRINNLVSSDLSSMDYIAMWTIFLSTFIWIISCSSADIVVAIESPFQVVLCIIFLYQILGWRWVP